MLLKLFNRIQSLRSDFAAIARIDVESLRHTWGTYEDRYPRAAGRIAVHPGLLHLGCRLGT